MKTKLNYLLIHVSGVDFHEILPKLTSESKHWVNFIMKNHFVVFVCLNIVLESATGWQTLIPTWPEIG